MVLRIEDLKEVCNTILPAVNSNELSSITETLQLLAEGGILTLSVTNREYFVTVKLGVDPEEKFLATVNANLFLKLVSQTTSEVIELTTTETSLVFKGNGTYKLPLIYDNDKLLELPKIEVNNVSVEFDIDGNILLSVLNYNSKQITIGTLSRPVQKMFYIDEQGALTFTSGACINNFTLPKPVKMLINQRVVKLFKLFKASTVHFELGHDALSDDIIQTKVKFENAKVCLTAILSCDDQLINSVPVTAIRGRATALYPYSVTFNKNELIESIDRMRLFISSISGVVSYAKFVFGKEFVTISDVSAENRESIYYENAIESMDNDYCMYLDLNELSAILDTCNESHLIMRFGDSQAITFSRANIINVIPEVRMGD